jgi:hypothetical protein
VVTSKVARSLLCFLLAALVVVQVTLLAHHTCFGHLVFSAGDSDRAVLDQAPDYQDIRPPMCVACGLAYRGAVVQADSAPAAPPPLLGECVVEIRPSESGPDVAEALLPRPPPPSA